MRIGVLGTGGVAQTMAAAWSKAGHEVNLGSHNPESKSLDVPVRPLADVVAGADVVVNATPRADSLDTLIAIGAPSFAGKGAHRRREREHPVVRARLPELKPRREAAGRVAERARRHDDERRADASRRSEVQHPRRPLSTERNAR